MVKERLKQTLDLVSLKVSLEHDFPNISSLISFMPSLPSYKTSATQVEPNTNRNLSLDHGVVKMEDRVGGGEQRACLSVLKCSWKCCLESWYHGILSGLF